MAEQFITPRVRAMLICDSYEQLEEEEVYHLFGVRYQIGADHFPFTPSELYAFVLFSSPRKGKYPGSISIEHAQTNKIIHMAGIQPEFVVDGQFSSMCFRIHCRFPQPGQYRFVLSFFQPSLDKQDMIRAEIPFWVIDERE